MARGLDGLSRSSSSSAEDVVSRKRSSEAATLRLMPCCCDEFGWEAEDEEELVDERERDLGRGT